MCFQISQILAGNVPRYSDSMLFIGHVEQSSTVLSK